MTFKYRVVHLWETNFAPYEQGPRFSAAKNTVFRGRVLHFLQRSAAQLNFSIRMLFCCYFYGCLIVNCDSLVNIITLID